MFLPIVMLFPNIAMLFLIVMHFPGPGHSHIIPGHSHVFPGHSHVFPDCHVFRKHSHVFPYSHVFSGHSLIEVILHQIYIYVTVVMIIALFLQRPTVHILE